MDKVHERNRRKVCVICYRKSSRNLSPREIAFLSENVIANYSVENCGWTSGICNGCHLLLMKARNGEAVSLPLADDYDPRRSMNTRSSKTCDCRICAMAKLSNQDAAKLKRKPGRPACAEKTEISHFKICGNCFAQIYRGSRYSLQMCASRREKVCNVEKLLNSPQTKQRVASRTKNEFSGSALSNVGRGKRIIQSPVPNEQGVIGPTELSNTQKRFNTKPCRI